MRRAKIFMWQTLQGLPAYPEVWRRNFGFLEVARIMQKLYLLDGNGSCRNWWEDTLPLLRALVHRPGHFGRVILLALIGAYLWQRKLPRLMQWKILRRAVHFFLSHRPAKPKRCLAKK